MTNSPLDTFTCSIARCQLERIVEGLKALPPYKTKEDGSTVDYNLLYLIGTIEAVMNDEPNTQMLYGVAL
jgi:hypothetical protein